MAVLEVRKPAWESSVDVRNDHGEAVAVTAFRPGTDSLLELLQTLGPRPAHTPFKVVSQKVETTGKPGIYDAGFEGVQSETGRGRPLPNQVQCQKSLGFRATQEDEIIGVPHHVKGVPRHQMVQRVKVDVRQQGTQDSTLRGTGFRRPCRCRIHDLLGEERFDEAQKRVIGNLLPKTGHEEIMGNRIEVGLEVRIHDKCVALMKQGGYLSQCILAAAAGAKPIALAGEVPLKDRFQNIAQRSLDNPVPNRGNTQRSFLPRSRFGNPNSLYGLGSVRPRSKSLGHAPKVLFKPGLEHLDGLVIDSRSPLVGFDHGKGRPEVAHGVDLVHQAVPSPPFHPVFQGRQHAIRPDIRFHPGPAAPNISDRFSLMRHLSRSVFRLSGTHASTFLPPFAPRPLRRLIAPMEALTPARLFPTRRSPCFTHVTFLHHSVPNHLMFPCRRFVTLRASAQRDSFPGSFSELVVLLPSRVQASPLVGRLAGTYGRIGFVILRTGRSPPVALHPALRRRSYSRLQAVALTWRGLAPL